MMRVRGKSSVRLALTSYLHSYGSIFSPLRMSATLSFTHDVYGLLKNRYLCSQVYTPYLLQHQLNTYYKPGSRLCWKLEE